MREPTTYGVSHFNPGSAVAEMAGQLATRQLRKEGLADQITELAAHIHAATFRLLELIREFDEREGWAGDGILSCAHWLNWKCGMALGVARERVRVAHALKHLPKISQTFRKGKISFSKVRAITRVATAKNESYLLMIAHFGTATHVERLVRNYRSVKRHEALARANEQYQHRELRWHMDDDGYWVIRGRLPPGQGAMIQQVLQQAMEDNRKELQDVPAGTLDLPVDETRPRPEPIALRRADALFRLAQSYRSQANSSGAAETHLVHVHTDLATLKHDGEGAEAEIESGGKLCAEATRRICCDTSVINWLEKHDGQPLSIGRKSRTIPPSLRRALQRRDGGCRFPGCTATRFVDAHHIHHWADGGETSMENLVLLCNRHHHLVHEGEFKLEMQSGEFQFTNPEGKLIPTTHGQRSRRNVDSLFALNKDQGIRITPKSSQSHWMGERMDDQMAVEGLLFRE